MNCKTSQVKLPKGTFQQEKTRTTPSGSGTTCAVAGQAISGTRTCMRSPTQRRQRATVAEEETPLSSRGLPSPGPSICRAAAARRWRT